LTQEKWELNGTEFRVGDKVMVYFPEADNAPNGMGEGIEWGNGWIDDMNYAVGGVFEIAAIEYTGVEFVDYVDEATLHPHGGYHYPLSSLVKVG
jgi:hypothetical protein